jgi:hypothetical protein
VKSSRFALAQDGSAFARGFASLAPRVSARCCARRAGVWLALALYAGTWCVIPNAFVRSQTPATLPVSAIHPGMKGYGLTVFRGETPERFDVEVIDVLHRFRPDQDLILIRTAHPILNHAIVVGGMSGSPIYLEGKLVGAYAYGWSFGNEPVAGVTPIANMLAEVNRPLDPEIWRALGTLPTLAQRAPAADGGGARGLLARSSALSGLRAHAQRAFDWSSVQTAYGVPLPATTPLQLSGFGERALALLGDAFAPFGMLPVQAGSAAGSGKRSSTGYVDGGSLGVQLVRGDISAMAIGTVTHVLGKRLVGFGHPMLELGQAGLPTCTARVVHIFSSQQRSFKLAEPIAPLGALIQDRQAAIVVDQSLEADTVAVTVRIHGVQGAQRTTWNMHVASHRLLTPGLVLGAIVNSLEATVADRGDAVLEVDSRVRLDKYGDQVTKDFVYGAAGPTDGGALGHIRLFNVMSAAYANPFEPARVREIALDLNVHFGRNVETIVDARLPSDTVDPGAEVNLAVTLQHYDESEHTEWIPLTVPRSAAGESIEINVQAGDDVEIDQPKPTSLADVLEKVRAGYPATSLVLSTKLPAQGVKLRGQLVGSLPGSALDTFQPANEAERGALFPRYERKELPVGSVLTGSAKLKLNVRSEPLR